MSNFSENLNVTGRLCARVIDAETGVVLRTIEHHNLVVALGRQNYSKLLGGDVSASPVTQFGVGTSGTPATMADTALTAPFTKAVDSVAYPDNDVQFAFVLEAADSNGITIREFALLTATNVMFARTTPAPIIKDNTIRVEATWTIKF